MNFNGTAHTVIKAVGKPAFIYGTAWKKEQTARLVREALAAGFTAIDTAAQPRHYREELVGQALREAFKEGKIKREDICLQTKFTAPQGQDPNDMPYDVSSDVPTQVRTSVASSLRNLRPRDDPSSEQESYIDCLLMHSPLGTAQATLQAWQVLESYVPVQIRSLGISNVSLPMLEMLYNNSSVKPKVVQNRFYAATRYDGALRKFCKEREIVYESFWTLTGNPKLLNNQRLIASLANSAGVSREVALYSLVMSLGIVPLNGTMSRERMREDLNGIVRVKEWGEANKGRWEAIVSEFQELSQGVERSFRALLRP